MRYLTVGLCLLSASLFSQHTSDDFKDGAGCGPFPIYVNAGYSTSRFNDFYEVARHFSEVYQSDEKAKKRVHGVNLAVGSPIIWTTYPFLLSPVVEVRYVVLARSMDIRDSSMDFISNQVSVGAGLRYAFYPLVIQGQYHRILLSKQDYRFSSPGQRRLYSYGSKGDTFLLRLSFLDPAGSDGGFGIFLEYSWTVMNNASDDHLIETMRTFDPVYNGSINSKEYYRSFSAGLIIPLALRIR
jgi:hypothetical protein